MATLTIRNVDDAVKDRLRSRAARNHRSLEAELRAIVVEVAGNEGKEEPNLAEAIRRRFAPFGGMDDWEAAAPSPTMEPPAFEP